ncbi:hypothetical protein SERLA73DRAFT_117600 [Serpula lacrymans var. lacrymans S7.3]|uniref:RRM Nup35-type domain-containing protein n=2 Tax=Serpula lacrymans var. lacrymans TaxID=341189 RepID=F8QHG2_SERL3|nr:uncharacterized protein SERLADRAFT_472782 [Serpula lacrymans var. lacrymans S7.9]EGN92272.1 hypothetical protein SERLA73DRAFT_117600 [Serpula lacrymans var. lacrymans S7.3]EGO22239.1 hypothetical protein SERLADRAFT_472782 [Serpula lacrymans var. lacrymans S7.9]
MSNTANFHASGTNHWGGPSASGSLGTSLSDTFGQSRTHYQAGYMMSAAQNSPLSQSSQRVDEIPTIQTKAKLNHGLTRVPNFGMESMFEGKRQRQAIADEDAPPTNSINEIPQELPFYAERGVPRNVAMDSPFNGSTSRSPTAPQQHQTHYIIVFGYPHDKYNVTVDYFKSMGDATDPEPNTEIVNCFRIGYRDPGEALRAVRRNGEVLSGSWMVGVKWADPAQAEAMLGRSSGFASVFSSPPADYFPSQGSSNSMAVDTSPQKSNSIATPAVGTPIRLAPSVAAFRKGGSNLSPAPKQQQGGAQGTPLAPGANMPSALNGQSPSKGMIGQVSDLIFGW